MSTFFFLQVFVVYVVVFFIIVIDSTVKVKISQSFVWEIGMVTN